MTKRSASIVSCAVLAISCATTNTDTIKSAAQDDDSLDSLAMQIIAQGASDEATRPLALQTIARVSSRARPLIEDMASMSDDPLLAATARSVLHRSGEPGWRDELEAALDSEDGQVRTAALLALSIERTDRVFFAKHVLDPHPDARLTVVHALARIDAPWSGELLLCAASTDPVPAVRRAAMTALDPDIEDHAEFLVKALDDVDIASRVAASRVLGSSQQGAAMAISSGILEKPASAEGIYFSASALASQVELLSASAYLLEALSDPRENIRLTGLVALTASGARLDGLDDLASDPEDSVKVAWCRMTRTSSSSDRDLRVSVLEQILDGESPMEAMLAMAEEGLYDSVRNLVWWRLKSGSVSDQRYVLAHASHPFGDPALAIAGMQSPDPTVRLTAAASWLTR